VDPELDADWLELDADWLELDADWLELDAAWLELEIEPVDLFEGEDADEFLETLDLLEAPRPWWVQETLWGLPHR